MAILESGFIFNQKLLVEKKFYPNEEFLPERRRTGLLSGMHGLAELAFNDEIQKVKIGEYYILFKTKSLKIEVDMEEKKQSLLIYCIVEKGPGDNSIFIAMEKTLASFLDRYSIYDIQQSIPKTFQKFEKRIEKNFGDLALRLEDRFKSLY